MALSAHASYLHMKVQTPLRAPELEVSLCLSRASWAAWEGVQVSSLGVCFFLAGPYSPGLEMPPPLPPPRDPSWQGDGAVISGVLTFLALLFLEIGGAFTPPKNTPGVRSPLGPGYLLEIQRTDKRGRAWLRISRGGEHI